MAVPRTRCAAAGCTNFARGTTGFCLAHKRLAAEAGGDGGGGETFAERAEREEGERRRRAAAAFRDRVEGGNYRELFGGKLGGLMAQAAEEKGVGDELGALRFVMARLLAEEDDPVTLAKSVARIASVSIQAQRAQRAISGQLAEGLTDAITSILTELDAGG
ncbi:MAG: hypothetical protein AVDCRST_MAG19-464 [uncultured Thermomicrobiales bacterium]|uniref:Uncharacterized protein n=1 Tax=uncultured Thermomicrobiales bacterium TaxID=1645740 RepID=A0A6J4UH33_9BACT|nr:MAG: hypothetical protein AVDCRST_MAG19-464 [uncultured Thermomicrobiales bacterium]